MAVYENDVIYQDVRWIINDILLLLKPTTSAIYWNSWGTLVHLVRNRQRQTKVLVRQRTVIASITCCSDSTTRPWETAGTGTTSTAGACPTETGYTARNKNWPELDEVTASQVQVQPRQRRGGGRCEAGSSSRQQSVCWWTRSHQSLVAFWWRGNTSHALLEPTGSVVLYRLS